MVATAVVRDRFAGRDMAEVMSLIFMVFMAMPIIAPGVAVHSLLTGPWQSIFVFMAGLATLISLRAFFRLPETLHPEYRRELTCSSRYRRLRHRPRTGWRCSTALPVMFPVRRHVRLRVLEPADLRRHLRLGAFFPSPSRPWRE